MAAVATLASGVTVVTPGTTRYAALAVTAVFWQATEAQAEIIYRFGGTLSKFGVRVTTAPNGSSTCRIRKNQANSSLAVTIPGATTGLFEDNTNTVTYASGDTLAWQAVAGAGGSSLLPTLWSVVNTPTANATTKIGYTSGGALTAASAVRQQIFGGFVTSLEATNIRQTNINFAATAKNMSVMATANTRSANTAFRLRKNNANASSLVTVTALTTGLFEDTTNTDSIAANDDLAWQTTTGVGASESLTIASCLVDLENTTNAKSNLIVATGSNNSSNTNSALTTHYPLSGRMAASATEPGYQADLNLTTTLSDLAVLVATNTLNGSSTIKSRKNGADGNMLVTYGASTSGAIEDNTNTDSLVDGDLTNYQLVTGGSSGNIQLLVIGCVSSAAGGATTYNVDITESAPAIDALIRSYLGARGLVESAPAADTLDRSYAGVRAIAESAVATDAWDRVYSGARSNAEVAPASDAWERTSLVGRTLVEAASAVDSWTRTGRWIALVSESALGTDDWDRHLLATRGLVEMAPVSDDWTRLTLYARVLAESAPATDAWTRTALVMRALTELAAGDDQWAIGATGVVNIVEGAPATDGWLVSSHWKRALTESAPATEEWSRAVSVSRIVAESAPAVSGVQRVVTYARVLAQAAPAVDSFALRRFYTRGWSESAPATDQLALALRFVRVTAELANALDNWDRMASWSRDLIEDAPALDTWLALRIGIVFADTDVGALLRWDGHGRLEGRPDGQIALPLTGDVS